MGLQLRNDNDNFIELTGNGSINQDETYDEQLQEHDKNFKLCSRVIISVSVII